MSRNTELSVDVEPERKPGYKNTKLGWIPEDWSIYSLGELMDFKNGVNADKESYGQGFKFVNVMEIIGKNKITDNLIPGKVNLSKKLFLQNNLISGDVVFNRTSETANEIGWTALYQGNEDVVFGGFVIRGRFKNDKLKNGFKKYCFHSSLIRRQIIVRGQGAVRTNIGQKDLEKVLMPIPSDKEQNGINTFLSTWDDSIEKLSLLLKKKKLYKKGLMQQLLTGKKRLSGFSGEWKKISAGKIFKSVSIKNNPDAELLSVTQDRGVIPRRILEARVTMPTGKRDSFKLVQPGNFVISLRSFQGGLEFSDYEGLVSPAYTVLEEKKKIDRRFYKHYFKSHDFIGHLSIAVIGIRDGKQISYSDFCTVKIPDISLREQSQIADVLEKIDLEISLLLKKKDLLQIQKKGLMQQLLTGNKRLLK